MSAKTLILSIRNSSFCHIGLIAIAIAACLASQGCSPWASRKLDEDIINAYTQSPLLIVNVHGQFPNTRADWLARVDIGQEMVVNIVAGPKDLFHSPTSQKITLKYSDEAKERIIWKYYDYSTIKDIRVSDDDRLFFVIGETFPFKYRSLYIYDLKDRKRIGRIKIDLNKTPEKDIPF